MDCVNNCLKSQCPKWVILTQNLEGGKTLEVGKCADAWMPSLLIELRLSIDKIDKKISELKI